MERRQELRIELHPCGEAEGAVAAPGMVRDLSATGMAVVAERPFEPGSVLELGFDLANPMGDGLQRIEVRAEVIQSQPLEGEEGYRIGLHFLSMEGDGERRLRDYLEEMLAIV